MRLRLLLAAILVAGCASSSQTAIAQSARQRDSTPTTVAGVDSLIARLALLPGRYRYLDAEREMRVFEGSESLFYALSGADTLAVPRLVECLGDTRPSNVTLDGKPVRVASLCFHALGYTDYYSRRLRISAWMSDLQLFGVLPAKTDVTDAQLLQARDWWRRYLAAGSPVRK